MPSPRWLVHAVAVLDGDTTRDTINAAEGALARADFHVFTGVDVRGDRARHRLTFAVISTGHTRREALYSALLDARIAITAAGGKLETIEDDVITRLGP